VSDKRRGLGRGLGALIPTAPGKGETSTAAGPSPVDVLIPGRSSEEGPGPGGTGGSGATTAPPAEVAGAHFAEVPLDSITPNPRQPREVFEEEALAELVHSLREVGLLQPIVVRPLGGEPGAERYELIMGERRWRAAREAGFTSIPAIVRSTGDDVMLRDALLENLHRSQLNPLEEAAAYDQLLQDFGCTHDELAGRIGRSRPQISNTLRLLKLPPLVQRRVAAGVLSAGHARALLGLEDAAGQERLAQRIVAEGLSVRSVEEIVALGGDAPERVRTQRGARPVAPKLGVLAERLSDRFETRVKVDLGRSKGRIVVEFASIDDLERIVRLMAPDTEVPADVAATE
jgi:ParB family chromosome partitioning protein